MKTRRERAQTVLLCAVLVLAFAFDRACLFRYALLAAVLHEAGHIVAFLLLCKRMPRLRFGVTGIAMNIDGERLSLRREVLLLLAGPLTNFIVAGVTFGIVLTHASYGGYFFACENLLMGLFNLLPIGMLDGGRLLENLIGPGAALISLASVAGLCLTVGILLYYYGAASLAGLIYGLILLFLALRVLRG
ncbi:site-2 protease family protein [Pygmaiobacter massiliensis]|uniref:site-2 protease family protein n=1 Tax=Pygmaiobacter massiliensis TaxID=1917873 RepID=UPI0011AEEC53|nr:site-2 protease family protein [Pygmaiobacter massiliensis]